MTDPKILPEWLQKCVKKIERALRLHIPKQPEWQKTRVDTLKHMRELLAPWKLTEAQMRKLGDHDAADDDEFSKELGADLCKTLKDAAQKQLDEHNERDEGKDDNPQEDAAASRDNESGDENSTSPGKHPTPAHCSPGECCRFARGAACNVVITMPKTVVLYLKVVHVLGDAAQEAEAGGASGSVRKSLRSAMTNELRVRVPACPSAGSRITFPATTTVWNSCKCESQPESKTVMQPRVMLLHLS